VIEKKVKPSKRTENNKIPILEESIERMKTVIQTLKLPDVEPFLNDKDRHECPSCKRNRKYLPLPIIIFSFFPLDSIVMIVWSLQPLLNISLKLIFPLP